MQKNVGSVRTKVYRHLNVFFNTFKPIRQWICQYKIINFTFKSENEFIASHTSNKRKNSNKINKETKVFL